MNSPAQQTYNLREGAFRALEWQGKGRTAIFLHGLSGVAEVWTPTIDALDESRPHCIAIDQRGHGHSPQPENAYRVADYVTDVVDLVKAIGAPVDLVGHSMGARVALVAAARHPQLFRSAAIVDIGPEAWQANINESVAAFARMPDEFRSLEAALEYGSRGRRGSLAAERFFLPRLRRTPGGRYRWLASREALVETVTLHRARNYWAEWEAIDIPALLVRGGKSNELRPHIAEQMRARNGNVRFVEIPDVGHNIPLIAPERLAAELTAFWTTVGDYRG
jgi:pimeloyl-ACP methyl ester carboxylesterase